MQVTETNTDGLKREFRIVVPAGELEEKITSRLGEIGQSIVLPGFRPGKVPLKMIAQQYGPQVRSDVIADAVQTSFNNAVREQNLRVMDPTAVAQCMEHNMPILVFNFKKERNIERAVNGERVGTIIGARD